MIWKWFAPIILGTLEYDFKGLIDDPSIATFRVGYGASVRIYPSNRAKLTTGQATARCLTGVGERSRHSFYLLRPSADGLWKGKQTPARQPPANPTFTKRRSHQPRGSPWQWQDLSPRTPLGEFCLSSIVYNDLHMERGITFSAGEYYHIYNRGVEKRHIFETNADRKRFLRLLYVCNGSKPVIMRDYQGLPFGRNRQGGRFSRNGCVLLDAEPFSFTDSGDSRWRN